MTVPYAFANLSGNIALAKLDSNFNTPITIGNTSVLLGNTVTTLNNLTLANVTITSGTSNVTNVNVTNVTVTNLTATLANVTTLNVASAYITSANIGTLALTNALPVSSGGTGQVTFPANSVLLGNGTGGIATVAPGNVGNVLTSIGGVWVSNVALSGAAAGANTQVQYNNSGVLGASANLTFDGTNLGIGTSSPNVRTEVSGTEAIVSLRVNTANSGVSASNYSQIQLSDVGTVRTYWRNVRDGSGATQFAYNSVLAFLSDAAGTPTERMRLDFSGNLGIGTSSPAYKLDVAGSVRSTGTILIDSSAGATQTALQVNDTSTNAYTAIKATSDGNGNGVLGLYFINTETIHLAGWSGENSYFNAGNVGIGTTSPNASAILDVQSTTKGVRMPNMTTTQKNAISSPAAGLMVFYTTLSKLCVYSGSAWQTITSV
jgi:hypothetical protein